MSPLKRFPIDSTFVEKWSPKYCEGDDAEYNEIVQQVRLEIRTSRRISEETFVRIIKWKARRLLGKGWIGKKLQSKGYEKAYGKVIADGIRLRDEERIGFLSMAPGIKAPVASTILHFMYPNEFPIMDFRTVRVLNKKGYIKWKERNVENYPEFRRALQTISDRTRHSLREIDMALFAYDKM